MRGVLNFLVPLIAKFYIHLVAATSQIIWFHTEIETELLKRHAAVIYTSWHGRQFFLVWVQRNKPISVLISQSKDGELIARTAESFGITTVRGSSSRGGARALVELMRVLQSKKSIAITPDGPRGPQKTVHEGILFLAQKTGAPILPVAYSCRHRKIFRGWDEYWLPLPFNRIAVGYAPEVYVGAQDSLESKAQELQSRLNGVVQFLDGQFA